MEKQILTLSKKDVIILCIKEIERCQTLESTKTNRSQIAKMFIIADMVKNASDNATFKVEGVRGNHEIRDFELFNCGSMVECLVKHYRKSYEKNYKSFNHDKADEWDGIMKYEIKASLPNARNTVNTNAELTILVNCKGAYSIKKSASKEIPTDKKGKYYENMDYSVYRGVRKIETLSNCLSL